MIPSATSQRGPAPMPADLLTASMSGPPIMTAMVVDDAVTTFDRPMYRPDEAFGMMSVMSAQSTERKVPWEAPNRAAPTVATRTFGDAAMIATPTAPSTEQ